MQCNPLFAFHHTKRGQKLRSALNFGGFARVTPFKLSRHDVHNSRKCMARRCAVEERESCSTRKKIHGRGAHLMLHRVLDFSFHNQMALCERRGLRRISSNALRDSPGLITVRARQVLGQRERDAILLDEESVHASVPVVRANQPNVLRHAWCKRSFIQAQLLHDRIHSVLRHEPVGRPLPSADVNQSAFRDIHQMLAQNVLGATATAALRHLRVSFLCASRNLLSAHVGRDFGRRRWLHCQRPDARPRRQHVASADVDRKVVAKRIQNEPDLLFRRSRGVRDGRARVCRSRQRRAEPRQHKHHAPVLRLRHNQAEAVR
mmetsp:Transcript_7085/g.18994  ORF Transcript_7085/g.18994 Transcript_7085/m.18994 type:complete len:319 (+) Transcript_7085:238-1194(+)